MNGELKNVLDKLPKEAAALLTKCANEEELDSVLKKFNISLSEEDVKTVKAALGKGGELLNMLDLEQVAGGLIYF